MNEQELIEVLSAMKDALGKIVERVDNLEKEVLTYKAQNEERVNGLEKTLFEDILEPAKVSMEAAEKDARYTDFAERYGEKFQPLVDDAKKVEGEDYDLLRTAFDEYDALEEKPDEAEYMDAVYNKVLEQLNAIREQFGAEKIEIKAESDGDVEVKADGKDITDEIAGGEGGEEKPDEIEETEKVEISGGNPETDDPEEIAKLMAEFEKSK